MSPAQRTIAAMKQQQIEGRHRKVMFKIKPSTAAVYLSIFALVIVMVSIGYRAPQDSSVVANASNVNTLKAEQTSVDSVVATNIAASVAQAANLPVAVSVANLAISAQTQSEFTQSTTTVAVKPQIIGSSSSNRLVTSYTVNEGDTLDSLAAQFGITKDTIKWANNLAYDSIAKGSLLQVLPVDGVIYNVKTGDTIESISKKYGVDKERLVLYNDLDLSGLLPNTKIILPNATLPKNERPGYVAPATYITYTYAGQGSGFGGTTWRISRGTPRNSLYFAGNCTLYAYNRRKELGLTVGDRWGNAVSWAQSARNDGLTVNHTPSVGAIMQNGGYLGHVAIVENILENGDLSISEMNAYVPGGGWNIVSGRIVPAGNVSSYLFIH